MTPEIFALGYQAENRLPPWQWAFENVRLKDSPYGERFVVEETPWLKELLETLPDGSIQEVVLMCCAQGGKSVTMYVALAWALDQRPGFTLFAAQTIDAAEGVAKQKIHPILESVPTLAAAMPTGKKRHNKSLCEIIFSNGTLLIGPANESFFRGHTVQWFFGDECSVWDPGKMEQGRARTTRVWNRKIFFASTPLNAKSDLENAYKKGDQRKYHLATPCCGELIYLTSENIEKLFQWDTNETTKPGGLEWNYPELRKTVRLKCPKCGIEHKQTEDMYRKMIAGARYVVGNPLAPAELRSYAFNVLCLPPSVFPWTKVVEDWISAKQAESRGDMAPLREFITLRLAETWDERKFMSFTLPNFEAYDVESEWELEKFRCLTVDCQEHLAEFWVVARAWGRDGSSRMLGFAKVYTEAEIIEMQKRFRIKPHLVGVDCSYRHYSVYDMCLRNGWLAMRGDDRVDWLHQLDEKRTVKRPYSQFTRGDPRSGKSYQGRTYCMVVNWSNPSIKDVMWQLKEGKGARWAVCDLGPEMSEVYAKGLDSERKREELDRYGRTVMRWKKIRANHPWDAECMSTVYAQMAGLFVYHPPAPDPAPLTPAAG